MFPQPLTFLPTTPHPCPPTPLLCHVSPSPCAHSLRNKLHNAPALPVLSYLMISASQAAVFSLSLLSTIFMPRLRSSNLWGLGFEDLETMCRSVGYKERKAYSRWDDAFGSCEGAAVVCAPRSHTHLIVCWTLIPRTVDSFLAWCLTPLSVSSDKGGGIMCWRQTGGITVFSDLFQGA